MQQLGTLLTHALNEIISKVNLYQQLLAPEKEYTHCAWGLPLH